MGAYDSARALAARLIAAKGRLVGLERRTDGPPLAADKPWRTGPAASSTLAVGVPAVFFQYEARPVESPFAQYGLNVGKLSVPEASEQVYLAASALGVRPAVGDVVLDGRGARRLEVVQLEVLAPGDFDVLYVLYVKE